MSGAPMHADPPALLSRPRCAKRPLALSAPLETAAKHPPLVYRARAGQISGSGLTRASVTAVAPSSSPLSNPPPPPNYP